MFVVEIVATGRLCRGSMCATTMNGVAFAADGWICTYSLQILWWFDSKSSVYNTSCVADNADEDDGWLSMTASWTAAIVIMHGIQYIRTLLQRLLLLCQRTE